MIITIDAINAELFKDILTDVYRLRARVFHDRLRWDVVVQNGCEFDEFDQMDPMHLVSLSDEGEVVGCLRVLQTTGSHMLADVFSAILEGEAPLRSPQIWEATRFCVDTARLERGFGKNTLSWVTSELMIAAATIGLRAGVTDAIAVIDPIMDRVLRVSGNGPYDYLGTTVQMGKVKAMAGLLDCTLEREEKIREYAGIQHDVFLSEAEALTLHANRPNPYIYIETPQYVPLPASPICNTRFNASEEAAQNVIINLHNLSAKAPPRIFSE